MRHCGGAHGELWELLAHDSVASDHHVRAERKSRDDGAVEVVFAHVAWVAQADSSSIWNVPGQPGCRSIPTDAIAVRACQRAK